MHPTVLIVPGHPLERLKRKLTLEDIARFPIVTYDRDFPAHARIARVFEKVKPEGHAAEVAESVAAL